MRPALVSQSPNVLIVAGVSCHHNAMTSAPPIVNAASSTSGRTPEPMADGEELRRTPRSGSTLVITPPARLDALAPQRTIVMVEPVQKLKLGRLCAQADGLRPRQWNGSRLGRVMQRRQRAAVGQFRQCPEQQATKRRV